MPGALDGRTELGCGGERRSGGKKAQDGLMIDGGTGKQSQMKRAAKTCKILPVLEQKGWRAQQGFLNGQAHGNHPGSWLRPWFLGESPRL